MLFLFVLLFLVVSALASATAGSITDATIHDAVALWMSNQSSCISTYGHISFWDTGSVTNVNYLFCAFEPSGWNDNKCKGASFADFNEDISGWDLSQVTDTR